MILTKAEAIAAFQKEARILNHLTDNIDHAPLERMLGPVPEAGFVTRLKSLAIEQRAARPSSTWYCAIVPPIGRSCSFT